ncbi:hypothetical protein [Roseitalea porphyridii]|nr:hypothetical protein [Roseitalea porphyridii]
MTRKPQNIDRQCVDYERVRRRAAAERRQVMSEVIRTVFSWRARTGSKR